MPQSDIIDNRKEKLLDHILRILPSSDLARFAVGYFFLSGFTGIEQHLYNLKQLKLLIGNTSSMETIEQLAEGYRQLALVQEFAEQQRYPDPARMEKLVANTENNIRDSLALMEQTDANENLITSLIDFIRHKKLLVRVYTKGRLHAKAYIFDYQKTVFDQAHRPITREENGIAIVGSSNLTLSGHTDNTELNVIVPGNANHEQLVSWFEELWSESEDFDKSLMRELTSSWAKANVTPKEIYLKTLYTLVKDRLESSEETELWWRDEIFNRLADFQRVAVHQAIRIIHLYGGVFISDVVGLGKSFIGAAIVKHFESFERARPLIICPPSLIQMWERYNETYQLNARVLSSGALREDDDAENILADVKYRDRNFVLVDESHHFRHPSIQRYKLLQSFLRTGKPCCFLTATPRNKSAWDIFHQIKLFHQQDITNLPIDPPNLRQFFKRVDRGDRQLPSLLSNLLIRRTRNHVLRWYGYDTKSDKPIDPENCDDYFTGEKKGYILVDGKRTSFPERDLHRIEYSLEATYQGLYDRIRRHLAAAPPNDIVPANEQLTYARYGLGNYVAESAISIPPYSTLQRAGANLRGLVRILMFKRLESSVYAFRQTVLRLARLHESFLDALNEGVVPAGKDAQQVLYESDSIDQSDLIDALRELSSAYSAADFKLPELQEAIEQDLAVLRKLSDLVEPIDQQKDAKFQKLKEKLSTPPLNSGKVLIFTQFADTARYLYECLNPKAQRKDIEVIYSDEKRKDKVAARFAPKANPEYQLRSGDTELSIVIATDVLSEGLNLQDCDKIINYDLHWNPVRLIQRFGRIDRLGTEHEKIHAFNFFPETEIEQTLGLQTRLENRIREIHDTIGEDSAILDQSEQLNTAAMYAIYESNASILTHFEEQPGDIMDISEAEEMFRRLRTDDPDLFKQIISIRDGVRSTTSSDIKGAYVFCEAGSYKRLYLLDPSGNLVSEDTEMILSILKTCATKPAGAPVPKGFNQAVERIKERFLEEINKRRSDLHHSLSLTAVQRYVLDRLRIDYGHVSESGKTLIKKLELISRRPLTHAATQDLMRLRKQRLTGDAFIGAVEKVYTDHNLFIQNLVVGEREIASDTTVPRIICSLVLL